jgi:hypothetical protein
MEGASQLETATTLHEQTVHLADTQRELQAASGRNEDETVAAPVSPACHHLGQCSLGGVGILSLSPSPG